MGTGPPAFTEVDNPASFADSLFVRVSYEVVFVLFFFSGKLRAFVFVIKLNFLFCVSKKQ